jgi:hypothetical protein
MLFSKEKFGQRVWILTVGCLVRPMNTARRLFCDNNVHERGAALHYTVEKSFVLSRWQYSRCMRAMEHTSAIFCNGSATSRVRMVSGTIIHFALTVVVFGSLIGEFLGIHGWLRPVWEWFGSQGFTYLDLGRFWQTLLTVGLFFWAIIIFRGLRRRLRTEHWANVPWLFFYSALSIPIFYGVGLLAHPASHFTTTDFWRFWVVHLWVEDFLELFTTILVAYIFVLLTSVIAFGLRPYFVIGSAKNV